jgi:hypothetical protein
VQCLTPVTALGQAVDCTVEADDVPEDQQIASKVNKKNTNNKEQHETHVQY